MKIKLTKAPTTKVKKLLSVVACVALVLSLGVTAAFAASTATSAKVDPENIKTITSSDGTPLWVYSSLDENGISRVLLADEEATIYDIIENGKIIPPADDSALEIKVLDDNNPGE